MFDLILALFGGTYLAGKLALDSADSYVKDLNTKKQFEIRDQVFKKAGVPYKETDKLDEFIRCGEHREEIYKKIEKSLTVVFGNDYRDKFVLPFKGVRKLDRTKIIYSGEDAVIWARNLMLSQIGKINYGNCNRFDLGKEHQWEYGRKICEEMNKNFKANGVGLLRFEPSKESMRIHGGGKCSEMVLPWHNYC